MLAIYRNKALCVVVNVWNKCTMARNSVVEIVMEASNVKGATDGIAGVVGGKVEVTSGIGGVGACGIDSVGSSSCCACSAYGGIGGAGLGGAPRGTE